MVQKGPTMDSKSIQNPNKHGGRNSAPPDQRSRADRIIMLNKPCEDERGHHWHDLGLNLARCTRCGETIMHDLPHSAFDAHDSAR